ncbi:MAG: hypothetical protein ACTHJH_12090 [Marmoricola sp.]
MHVRIEDLIAHLDGEDRVGRVERIGPATLALLAEWLGDTDLRIRPVLDMSRTDAVDRHDPPEWMRELVIQRDRHCVFPMCDRDARTCDLDQNAPTKSLRGRRCKTFTAWRYRRLPDGDYLWTGPDGRTFIAPVL